jgi:hypothetical protein
MAGLSFDSQVTSLVNNKIVPKIVDGILSGNVLTMRLLGNGKPWSGDSIRKPLKFQVNSSGGSYSGFDTFSTTRVNNRVSLTWRPSSVYQSVVMQGMDVSIAQTPEGVVNFIKAEMESSQQDFMDRLGTQFYGTGGGNDIEGLRLIVDDGTTNTSYAGLVRATYATALNSSVTTAVGVLGLDDMATAVDAATIGNQGPTLIVTTPAVFSIFERLLNPTVSADYTAQASATLGRRQGFGPQMGLVGASGFRALSYRGIPIVADEKCTAGYMYFLNEDRVYWIGLKHWKHQAVSLSSSTIDGVYEDTPSKNHGIIWTGLKEPINQDAVIGQFLIYGQLVTDSPRHLAVLQGITG